MEVVQPGGTGSSSLTVTDGITTVYNVTSVDFTSGATVTDGGGGTVDISIAGGSGTGVNAQTPTGTVNSVNKSFTCSGTVLAAWVDGTLDTGAILSGGTITYSTPPQFAVYALCLGSTSLTLQTPTGTINSSNRTFTTTGIAKAAFVDGGIDTSAVITGLTIVYSTPPQFAVAALCSNSVPINPQIPSGTINGVNTVFTVVGITTLAFVDTKIDSGAIISGTTITYSTPPQLNVFAL